jgi:hypothetical protein
MQLKGRAITIFQHRARQCKEMHVCCTCSTRSPHPQAQVTADDGRDASR